ncbi:hypothetical protein SAMN05444003_2799 [Cognatiyoonia sediminum]|uniref:Uncharacterized protein n=1 Tax=Cognatiyoonia sediminum TaxID=1508389 RepID=A0A1M5S0K6_9RHOB|nr:hypothetical protein [Cognatiyoonia sediminum]SHH32127.1 hypothetical protein SAMN05444003_2799 [Cognatiyoonia sediminum]
MLLDGLFFPAVILAVLSWMVPKLLSFVMPEGVKPLLLLALLSTLILFLLSSVFFFVLYLWQGATLARLAEGGLSTNILLFGRLGMIAGMIWAPIMVLSVAALPRRWKKEVW